MVLTEFMGENAVGPGRFAAIQRWNDEQHGTEFTAVSFVRFLTLHTTTAPASRRGRCVPRVRQGPIAQHVLQIEPAGSAARKNAPVTASLIDHG
jgi:hypothetical protein